LNAEPDDAKSSQYVKRSKVSLNLKQIFAEFINNDVISNGKDIKKKQKVNLLSGSFEH
jgi:hypothetical protein